MLTVNEVMGAGEKIFGKRWNNPVLRAEVKARAEAFFKDLRHLVNAQREGPRAKHGAVYGLLRSFDAKFCSLILAWPKDRSPISLAEAYSLACSIDPRRDCGEPVRFRWEAKPEEGFRPIWSYGPKRRTLQKLAVTIVQALWGLPKFEFARRGQGRKAAVDNIIFKLSKKGGPRWIVTADVRNCFGSFDREKLLGLIPLPKAVVENCILVMDHVEIVMGDHPHTDTSDTAVLEGLPQGSLASPYIASKLIELSLAQLKADFLLSYADDIFAASATKKGAEAIQQALADLLLDHPAGPLFMKSQVARIGKPIDFLSYRYRRRWLGFGGGVRVTPSPMAFDRFAWKLYDKLVACEPDEFTEIQKDYTARWKASHPNWDRSPAGDLNMFITVYHHVGDAARARRKALADEKSLSC